MILKGSQSAVTSATTLGRATRIRVNATNAGTITITGKGAYLGVPKPFNGGVLTNPADAPDSITYDVELW